MKLNLTFILLLFLFSCQSEGEKFKGSISDLNKSELDLRIQYLINDLEQEEWVICRNATCISNILEEEIFRYEKKWREDSLGGSILNPKNFEQVYTFDNGLWNPTEIVITNDLAPGKLIDFTISTNKHFIIQYTSGGLITQNWFKVFTKDERKLSNHWIFSIQDQVDFGRKEKLAKIAEMLKNPDLQIYK